VEVAAERASQIRDRGEDTAGNDLALDFGEPDLDLVQPPGIGGGEVKLHARMRFEEIANQSGFRSGEVIENARNLRAGRAHRHHGLEAGHKVAAGEAGSRLAMPASGLGVQRSLPRKRALPVVLETVARGASRRKRQNGIESIPSWNRGLFLDTKHRRVLWRIQIQAENVGRFARNTGSSLAR